MASFEILSFKVNILMCFWAVGIVAFVVLFFVKRLPNLPNFLWNLTSYGKIRNMPQQGKTRRRSRLDNLLDVPKQWFTHFYVVSALCNGFLLYTLLKAALYQEPQTPRWYLDIVQFLTDYPLEKPKANQLSVLLVITLLFIQGVRRLYECLVISSYSKSTIHVAHYLLGVLFYALGGMSVIAEGTDFNKAAPYTNLYQLASQLTWFNVAGVAVFLWATYHHHVAHTLFAGLRAGNNDTKHRIPRGDWFELVSCPHYLAEILIYASLILVLGMHHTMIYLVFGFTVANQVPVAIDVHEWYKQRFRTYPKHRKAIIPWIL